MPHRDEEIWRRMLPEVYHEVLCTRYHLKEFLRDRKGRQDHYFAIVAEGPATLGRALPHPPTESDVLSWIAFVVGKDRTFLSFVSKHGGANEALEPEKWSHVLEAGAGAICGQYLVEMKKDALV